MEALESSKEVEVTHLVCAIRKPDNTIELITNTEGIVEKLKYLLGAYDMDMCLRTCSSIKMVDCMILMR